MRTLALSLLFAAAGCQCLVPVEEVDEPPPTSGAGGGAGKGGGGGAGGTGGGSSPTECSAQAFCQGPVGPMSWDCGPAIPSTSCIAGRCLDECRGPRICSVDEAAACLDCGGGDRRCASASCQTSKCSLRVEQSSCAAFENVTGAGIVDGKCRTAFTAADGRALGHGWRIGATDYLGFFAAAGGWCVGRNLVTGAPRVEWWCPSCRFVEVGCE